MSAIPLLMLVISVFHTVLTLTGVNWLHSAIDSLPDPTGDFLGMLVDQLMSDQIAVSVLSISAVTMLWAASKGVSALIDGLNSIYSPADPRHFIKRKIVSVLYTLMFIVIFVLSIGVLIFGDSLQALIEQEIPWMSGGVRYIFNFGLLFTVIILIAFFIACYTLLPDGRQGFLSQLPGALFAAAGWILFSFGLSVFIKYFSNYSTIYGNLASVIFATMWLYSCMIILMMGAELNIYLAGVGFSLKRRKKEA